MADLQWDVVEEVGVVVSYVPARFTGKNDGSLEERKGRQSALSPSHPHSEVFVDIICIFLLYLLSILAEAGLAPSLVYH